MACKGICLQIYGADTKYLVKGWKGKGYKQCATCELFMKTTDIQCQCCKNQFRANPRQKKTKDNMSVGVIRI